MEIAFIGNVVETYVNISLKYTIQTLTSQGNYFLTQTMSFQIPCNCVPTKYTFD